MFPLIKGNSTLEQEKDIRVYQLAKIPALFPNGGDHWNKKWGDYLTA